MQIGKWPHQVHHRHQQKKQVNEEWLNRKTPPVYYTQVDEWKKDAVRHTQQLVPQKKKRFSHFSELKKKNKFLLEGQILSVSFVFKYANLPIIEPLLWLRRFYLSAHAIQMPL